MSEVGPTDSVRRHFIAALARRAQAQPDAVRRVLEGKMARAQAEAAEHLEQTQAAARETVQRAAERFPESRQLLWQLFDAGDFRGLRRQVLRLASGARGTALADLRRHVAPQAAQESAGEGRAGHAPADLKALTYFRDSWSKLSVAQAVSQALAAGPANAGPLNSHALMLQALQRMRDTAPEYLQRFMAYADALHWLDQVNSAGAPAKKRVVRGDTGKKRKAGRGEAG